MAAKTKPQVMGYLPNDTPPFGQMVLLGLQHVLTMFPATVLAAILMKFPVSTVLTITGLGTVITLIVSKLALGTYIPLYYGSSFSYITAVAGIMAALGVSSETAVAPPEAISVVTAGFIATAIINVVVGFIIRASGGKQALDKVLPAIITGPVACTIGIGLGAAALTMSSGTCCGIADPGTQIKWWTAAIVTLLAAYIFSVYLQGKGFIGMLPILLAAVVGYLVAIPLGLVNWAGFGQEALLRAPVITLPR
ncbi:MAG: solute carrier family 23 protein, partial [Anaerolineae bacterium]